MVKKNMDSYSHVEGMADNSQADTSRRGFLKKLTNPWIVAGTIMVSGWVYANRKVREEMNKTDLQRQNEAVIAAMALEMEKTYNIERKTLFDSMMKLQKAPRGTIVFLESKDGKQYEMTAEGQQILIRLTSNYKPVA